MSRDYFVHWSVDLPTPRLLGLGSELLPWPGADEPWPASHAAGLRGQLALALPGHPGKDLGIPAPVLVQAAFGGRAVELSLVVNASGLGKDRPGSPVPDGAQFPRRSIVWEFNYRGTLVFLAQARAQREASALTVVDGWRYFIHGWSSVIAEVFGITLTPELVQRLSEAAQESR